MMSLVVCPMKSSVQLMITTFAICIPAQLAACDVARINYVTSRMHQRHRENYKRVVCKM